MNHLRVLLVDADSDRQERISSMLAAADHSVLPVSSLEEAEEALFVVKTDVALLGSPFPEAAVKQLAAKLRDVEKVQKNAFRAPVLAISSEMPASEAWSQTNGDQGVDGYLAETFDAETLVAACQAIAQSIPARRLSSSSEAEHEFPVFEPDAFQQQVGYDPDLAVEIIHLFLEERNEELPEMEAALEKGDYTRVSHVAHTIKGSLSSLHAMLARHHAQELELAAKQANADGCRKMLTALAEDLQELEPLLLKLRDELKPE